MLADKINSAGILRSYYIQVQQTKDYSCAQSKQIPLFSFEQNGKQDYKLADIASYLFVIGQNLEAFNHMRRHAHTHCM